MSHWNLDGAGLLDFGCGFGDMYGYCQKSGRTSRYYHGIDLNPRLIAESAKHYPDTELFARDEITEELGGDL